MKNKRLVWIQVPDKRDHLYVVHNEAQLNSVILEHLAQSYYQPKLVYRTDTDSYLLLEKEHRDFAHSGFPQTPVTVRYQKKNGLKFKN